MCLSLLFFFFLPLIFFYNQDKPFILTHWAFTVYVNNNNSYNNNNSIIGQFGIRLFY